MSKMFASIIVKDYNEAVKYFVDIFLVFYLRENYKSLSKCEYSMKWNRKSNVTVMIRLI